MMYATLPDGTRTSPHPTARCVCPLCKQPVVPKCGDIRIWHFAHESLKDCDTWGEGESLWHRTWKKCFPETWREVPIGAHRADVKTAKGQVIEFQASALSPEDILEREHFYENMAWVLNAETFASGMQILHRQGSHMPTVTVQFHWRHSHQSFWYARKPLFMDLTDCRPSYGAAYDPEIMFIKSMRKNFPCTGKGILVPKSAFLDHYVKGIPFPETKVPEQADYLENLVNEVIAEAEMDREWRSDRARQKAYENAGHGY